MKVFSAWFQCAFALWAGAGVLLAQGPMVTKTYDVRCLLAREHPWRLGDRQMPGDTADHLPRTGWVEEAPRAALSGDELVAILTRALGSKGNGAATPLLKIEAGLLFASASDEDHQRLSTWVDLCCQVFLEQVTFEMHLLPATTLAGAKGRMLRDEVDSILRAAGPHQVFTCSARVGGSATLQSNEGIGFVRDFDVEVAQKSTIQDPKMDVMVTGHAWHVMTTRCADGRLGVAVVGQSSDAPSAPRAVELPHRDLRGKRQLATLQLPSLRVTCEGAVARLADGDATVFGGDGDDSVRLLRVRRPQAIPLPSGSDWAWLATGDLTAPGQPAVRAHLRLSGPGDDAPLFWDPDDPTSLVLDVDQLVTRLGAIPGLQPEQVTLLPTALLQVQGEESVRRAAADLLRSMASSLVRDLTVDVRHGRLAPADATLAGDGRLDPAELAGRLPGTFLTATLLEDHFHRVSLVQHAFVKDYEVEIAQESAVPNPVIGVVSTGISISGRVTAAPRDRFRLFLQVSFAELVGDITSFDLKDEDLGPVDLARQRDLKFEVSPLVDSKRWTLMYLAPLHGTNVHFAVVARVRE